MSSTPPGTRRMPKSLNDPTQVLLWSLDEFIVVAILFGVGLIFRQLLLAIACIFIFLKVYRRFRDGRPNGFFQHLMYWYGFSGSETSSVRNPFIRRFLP